MLPAGKELCLAHQERLCYHYLYSSFRPNYKTLSAGVPMPIRVKDTLLLIGDFDSERANLSNLFTRDYNMLEAENLSQAMILLKQNFNCIVAVLADVPLENGSEILELTSFCKQDPKEAVPVLLMIPADDTSREEYAFSLGADDVIIKPCTNMVVHRRVHILADLFLQECHLEKVVEDQRETLRKTNQIFIDALSTIIEQRSTESGNHVLRIRRFTQILLREVADNCPEYHLTEKHIDIISSAAALHDIGKIAIPDAILNCPRRLTEAEFEIIKTHTTTGGRLIESLSGIGDEEFIRHAYNIAMYHHERWDGSGYPCGFSGDEIPICAQVVGIADAFDALTTDRSYKPALPYDVAINMVLNGDCGTFSPKLLECFKSVASPFMKLARQYADGYSPRLDRIRAPENDVVRESLALDSIQLSQMKYQTLMHYINDTIIELDINNQLYHVVYNPNPDLEALIANASFAEISSHFMEDGVHPPGKNSISEMREYLSDLLFRQNVRKHSFRCNIMSRTQGCHHLYEVTLLRIATNDPAQRHMLAVFHKLSENEPDKPEYENVDLFTSPMLRDLLSSPICCLNGEPLKITDGLENLMPLTGYSEEELNLNFGNSLISMTLPEDKGIVKDLLHEIGKHVGSAEARFRIVHKYKDYIWVLCRGRAVIASDGHEYAYFTLTDTTIGMEYRRNLEKNDRTYQLLLALSQDITFEWDLVTDTMACSSKWENRFGYMPISDNFSRDITKTSHFHPDELPTLRANAKQLIAKGGEMNMEARIANADGKYLWSKISASAIFDESNKPIRIVGLISDIDELKSAALSLKEQAERDALTNLLNKASTKQFISNYLTVQEPGMLSAMLIIDMDNFKAINDQYGHLYGDAVLAQAGALLNRLFRSHDVVGRIGGDEFLVLLKNIPDIKMVKARCELLLSSFKSIFSQIVPDVNASCSIGVVLTPEHGSSYAELFKRADKALYLAKKNGKNCYKIFDPKENYISKVDTGTAISTRIDSDEQPGMANNSFLRYVFHSLYESRDIPATINNILAFIGEQFNVSRVYIFENNDDNTACSNTFEWCNKGIAPEKDNLVNINYEEDIPGYLDLYNERGVFYCTDISSLPANINAVLEPQGIKSLLHCAIMDAGVFRGYVGFDECTSQRLWTQDQISSLEFLAEILAMFLLKNRSQDQAIVQTETLKRMMDNQSTVICVIDLESRELLYMNKSAKELVPDANCGEPCYKSFMGRNTPCENCPLITEDTGGSEHCTYNEHLDLQLKTSTAAIHWNGKPAGLVAWIKEDS